MSFRSTYLLWWCLSLGALVCVVYADFEVEATSESRDSSSSEEEDSDENLSNLEENRREKRFTAGEDEAAHDERTVVGDIAAVQQIVQFLEAVGQRVIPIIMQGAAGG